MNKQSLAMLNILTTRLGISLDDALALRRVSMTLHRWHELECGDGNDHGSWTIVRGHKVNPIDGGGFVYDDDGKPYLEQHHYNNATPNIVTYSRLGDREAGAKKRLAKIMAKYPTLSAYVQTDPRGCALYILRDGDVPAGADVSAYYSRGVPVYK